MTFTVKDLMISVSGAGFDTEPSTCTGWTKPTTMNCIDSRFDNAEPPAEGLSLLKDQLQQMMMARA